MCELSRVPPHVRPFASQEGGALQDGARSAQCTCCRFAACVGSAAGSQPAATLLCHVCCVAHTHVSQPPQPARHAVVCGLHIVSMASRAELCIKRHSTKKKTGTSRGHGGRWHRGAYGRGALDGICEQLRAVGAAADGPRRAPEAPIRSTLSRVRRRGSSHSTRRRPASSRPVVGCE